MKRFLLFTLSILFSTIIIVVAPLAKVVRPYLPFSKYLLGVNKPTSYTVLLGNDAEMRANGGFAGSYAKFTISTPVIASLVTEPKQSPISRILPKSSFSLSFQDIYVPNGQLDGLFVEPPQPIQQAFGHGTWELANADWEPNFPGAAQSIRWFMEKGHETNPDILALVNLSTIKKILNIVGSIPVPDYQATLTPDNLYLFLQGKAELNFFPGSTQKKDALTSVGLALVKKVKTLSLVQKLKIAQILYSDLLNQNISVHSTNAEFQDFLVKNKLAGVFEPLAFDTYSMIETNLGANKANAYVTRQTSHQITFSASVIASGSAAIQAHNPNEGVVHHQATIKFYNSSIEANPNPPFHYGGNYITYLRLYIPEKAQNIAVTRSPRADPPALPLTSSATSSAEPVISQKYGLTEIGFWHTTRAGSESEITLSYDLPLQDQKNYSLAILKQHGLVSSLQNIDYFGQLYSTNLTQTFYRHLAL